jgi:predicted HicB family RNase H-like nuclease
MGMLRNNALKANSGTNTLEYKGYLGVFEYDDEGSIFRGAVINLRESVTFQGDSVAGLRQSLRDSVEVYLALCAERGQEPEKPFSGNLPLRIDPELHRKIFLKAKREGKSLNRWIGDTLEKEAA